MWRIFGGCVSTSNAYCTWYVYDKSLLSAYSSFLLSIFFLYSYFLFVRSFTVSLKLLFFSNFRLQRRFAFFNFFPAFFSICVSILNSTCRGFPVQIYFVGSFSKEARRLVMVGFIIVLDDMCLNGFTTLWVMYLDVIRRRWAARCNYLNIPASLQSDGASLKRPSFFTVQFSNLSAGGIPSFPTFSSRYMNIAPRYTPQPTGVHCLLWKLRNPVFIFLILKEDRFDVLFRLL